MLESLTPDEIRLAAFVAFQTFNKEKKDLQNFLLAGRAIIQASLSLAEKHPDLDAEYRIVALMCSYNLSASCWPAWDDSLEGIGPAELDMGLLFAEFNVDLCEKMDLGPERRKNGTWILGAQLAVQQRFAEARTQFENSLNFAIKANDPDARMMAEGWCIAMDQLDGDRTANERLEALKGELCKLGDDGEFYAGQFQPFFNYLRK